MRELADLGVTASAVPGGVAFAGGWDACYRANLWSRLASRILWRIGEFRYRNEQEVYAAARAIDWPRYFGVELVRPLVAGRWPTSVLVHVAVLIAYAAAGYGIALYFARRRFTA